MPLPNAENSIICGIKPRQEPEKKESLGARVAPATILVIKLEPKGSNLMSNAFENVLSDKNASTTAVFLGNFRCTN